MSILLVGATLHPVAQMNFILGSLMLVGSPYAEPKCTSIGGSTGFSTTTKYYYIWSLDKQFLIT
jgi:hypothetical protein